MPTFSPEHLQQRRLMVSHQGNTQEGSLSCLLSLKHVQHAWKRWTEMSKHNRLRRKQTTQTAVWAFSSVQSCATPWTAAHQASLSVTNSGVRPNSCPLSQWCHPTISSSVVPFSSSLNLSQHQGLFKWVSSSHQVTKSIGVSASPSVLPANIQDWFPLEWAGWISLQSKGLSRVFSNNTVQKHEVFSAQLSSQSSSHIHIWPLEKP